MRAFCAIEPLANRELQPLGCRFLYIVVISCTAGRPCVVPLIHTAYAVDISPQPKCRSIKIHSSIKFCVVGVTCQFAQRPRRVLGRVAAHDAVPDLAALGGDEVCGLSLRVGILAHPGQAAARNRGT